MRNYQDHLVAGGGGTPGGAIAERHGVGLLKTFSTWLWRRSFYDTDPLARLEPPRLTRLHRVPFSQADSVRLLEAALLGPDPLMERCLLLLGLDTGARISELVPSRRRRGQPGRRLDPVPQNEELSLATCVLRPSRAVPTVAPA